MLRLNVDILVTERVNAEKLQRAIMDAVDKTKFTDDNFSMDIELTEAGAMTDEQS